MGVRKTPVIEPVAGFFPADGGVTVKEFTTVFIFFSLNMMKNLFDNLYMFTKKGEKWPGKQKAHPINQMSFEYVVTYWKLCIWLIFPAVAGWSWHLFHSLRR